MSTMSQVEDGPPGYKELCAKLQVERDPAKFQALVNSINHLLTEYEKSAWKRSVQPEPQEMSLEVLVSASETNSSSPL
jgi:hypothetical protein